MWIFINSFSELSIIEIWNFCWSYNNDKYIYYILGFVGSVFFVFNFLIFMMIL